MAGVKRKYIAQTGITFDKQKARVEAGDELPANIPQADLEELIDQGAIRVKDESEGEKK